MTRRKSLKAATRGGDRREELETLAYKLALAIDECTGHGMAALCREYRETVKELSELSMGDASDDPIARIVEAHGQPRADVFKLSAVQ